MSDRMSHSKSERRPGLLSAGIGIPRGEIFFLTEKCAFILACIFEMFLATTCSHGCFVCSWVCLGSQWFNAGGL